MYKVTAYFRDHRITKSFYDMYDAIEFKDNVDAHYPIKTNFEKVTNMKEFIYDSWNGVMNSQVNPLKHIPDLNTRHMVLQVLAWMWCIVFAFYLGSIVAFSVSAVAHAIVLAAIVITVSTFETARTNPGFFNPRDNVINSRGVGGEHE
jgi:hypothetical protein